MIEDVLNQEQLDRATLSPDGEWIAVVVRRGALPGQAYGRASYEVDPTRSDIWLISTRTGERRALTNGAAKAAGYWCATWSPDGERLAMLSTAPQGIEPLGGDNVRLYVWERSTGALNRIATWPVMTQTRYGGALDKLDLRGGLGSGSAAHACSTGFIAENAPFLWLDDRQLLVASLRQGEVSAALDHYTRPYRAAARDAGRVREGATPTASVVFSGAARTPDDENGAEAILRVVNVDSRGGFALATIPAYPFRGSLTVSVSPDRSRLAVVATTGALRPVGERRLPAVQADGWTVERRLGFMDLTPGASMRWTTMPAAARLPLELYGWSPDSRLVTLRARAEPYSVKTPLFTARANDGRVVSLGPQSIGQEAASVSEPHSPAALWVDGRRLVVRATNGKWLLLGGGRAKQVAMSPGEMPPDSLVRAGDGSLMALTGRALQRLDPPRAALKHIADMPTEASFLLPEEGDTALGRRLVLLRRDNSAQVLASMNTLTGALGPPVPAQAGDVLDVNLSHDAIVYSQDEGHGIYLRIAGLAGGRARDFLMLNGFLNRIDWGERRLIVYKGTDGADLNAAVILPPGYRAGRRYPMLVWVYGGYQVPPDLRGDYMTARWMPGIYNLYLYAARGYVVLVPSMPLGPRDGTHDVYTQLPTGVLPAVDRLVALGIADPNRVGVFGQSYGGYSVMGLLGQTDRFRAGVAIAGISDLAVNYGQFDPTAHGYPGIEHEKSDNWAEVGQFGLQEAPWSDPAGYARNSPLSHVDRVTTPLLLIHGDMDIRGASTQAELFFYALYAQGKTAELVRYGGESHSLAQSPANVRDVFERTISWFDRYLLTPNVSTVPGNPD